MEETNEVELQENGNGVGKNNEHPADVSDPAPTKPTSLPPQHESSSCCVIC
jgi:hypothetical protein